MELSAEQWNALNEQVIEEFRANGGRCGGHFEGNPMILLTTRGAKSGKSLTTPLTYTRDGERIIVVASAGGAPRHPAWYHNLRAHPQAEVEIDDTRFHATAHAAEPPERERLYAQVVAQLPRFDEYRKATDRVIPVVILTREG